MCRTLLWGKRRRHNRSAAVSRYLYPAALRDRPSPYYGFPVTLPGGNPPSFLRPVPSWTSYSRRDRRRIESGVLPPTWAGKGVPSLPWTGSLHTPWLCSWIYWDVMPSSGFLPPPYRRREWSFVLGPLPSPVAIYRRRWVDGLYHPTALRVY